MHILSAVALLPGREAMHLIGTLKRQDMSSKIIFSLQLHERLLLV